MSALSLPSPTGTLTLFSEGDDDGREVLVAVEWGRGSDANGSPLLDEAARQLDAYFAGQLENFDLPLAPKGTGFQQAVWQALVEIPYAATRTYGDIADDVGSVSRAVGQACGQNPIPIIIPCHRVVAAGGRMGGFSGSGGVDTKRWLLGLEGAMLRLETASGDPGGDGA